MHSKKVIWLENKKEDNLKRDISNFLLDYDLIVVKDLDEFAETLFSIKENENDVIKGFIVDMMLSGPNTLIAFGIDESWDHTKKDGGEMLIRYVLRSKDFEYQEIPILVLSVRSNLEVDLEKYKKTKIVVKRSLFEEGWKQDIKKWVDKLKSKRVVI